MSNAPAPSSRIVLALVRDLIFATKIMACAKAAGVHAHIIRDPATLAEHPGSLLLADLNQAGVIVAAMEWKHTQNGRVIGFVSHVDTATIEAARVAGIDHILARSGFVQQLPQLLADVQKLAE